MPYSMGTQGPLRSCARDRHQLTQCQCFHAPKTSTSVCQTHSLAHPAGTLTTLHHAWRQRNTATAAPSRTLATRAARTLNCDVQQAATDSELRAAAFLRAISFYTYPPGRSEYATRSHRHMKANNEWESVTAKVEGRDVAFKDLDVTCFIATIDDVDHDGEAVDAEARRGLLTALRAELDACAQLPAESNPDSGVNRPRRLVVGSLDLNVGHTLPSEELIGRQPQANPRHGRAYLSNVCVAAAARRLGVARSLLRYAEGVALQGGVEWLYVHVVADNIPAVALYCDALGFQVEQSESEGVARSLRRPRRLLLAKRLAGHHP